MSNNLKLPIKESMVCLKQLKKKQPSHLQCRVQMLLLMKTKKALTVNGLSIALGVNRNSIQGWRTKYKKGGIKELLSFKRTSHKPSVITPMVHQAIAEKLHNPSEAFRSFKELQEWIEENFIPHINYHTVNKYVKRKFGAKLKVARRSHIKKDRAIVEDFKKNT